MVTTTKPTTTRDVARVDRPAVRRGMNESHRVRPLVEPGEWAWTDPFLLLMEDWFPEGVFDRHPHRGIETVTMVLDGSIEHYDNHGNKGTLHPGDVQWLTAGRGLIHNEKPAPGQTVHILQLWVNLPSTDKLVSAHHQELKAESTPIRRAPGVEARVFSGSSGPVAAVTKNHVPVTMVDVRLEPHARFEQELPAGFNAFVVALEGSGTVGASEAAIQASEVAWLTRSDEPSTVRFSGGENGLRVVLFAGKPLGEPVAARGPFVMNTEAELSVGFAEYRAQGERFGL
jgi:quercetin 2,3-dioxygenase